MISAKKSFFSKAARIGHIDSDETDFNGVTLSGKTYAEKVAAQGLSFEMMQQMYLKNIWVRTVIDTTVNRAVDIPTLIKPIRFSPDDTGIPDATKRNIDAIAEILTGQNDSRDSFRNVKKKVLLDVLKFDAGAFEKTRTIDSNESKLQIYALPGNTIKLNKNDKNLFKDKNRAYIQVRAKDGLQEVAAWPVYKVCYMMANPQSHRIYGLSKLESLVATVTADLFAESYNADFFENQATPRFAVMFEGLGNDQTDSVMRRMRKWWDQELKGKSHRPILLTSEGEGKIKFEKVSLTNQEMEFQTYSRWLLQKIMAAYGTQPIVIGLIDQNMGKLNSEEQIRIFKANAVKPLLTLFGDEFNYNVIFLPQSQAGLGMRDVYIDHDLDLDDKKENAEIHQIYSHLGVITINDIRVKFLGLPPVPWGNVPLLQNNVTPFGVGPNGPAVPPVESNGASEDDGSTQTSIVSRQLSRRAWENVVMSDGKYPVGWESLEKSERMRILDKASKYVYQTKLYSYSI